MLELVRRLVALEADSQHRLTRAQADQLQPLVTELLDGREVDEAACKQYREKIEGLISPDQSDALTEVLHPQRGTEGERQPLEPVSPFTGRARGHLAQLLGFLSVKKD